MNFRHAILVLVAALSLAADPAPTVPSQQLSWVLGSVATPPTDADAQTHFTEQFLAAVPKVSGVFQQLAADVGPLTLVRVEKETPNDLVAVVSSDKAGLLRVILSVGPDGRMGGLVFQPAADLAPAPDSWDAVDQKLGSLAPKSSLLAAEITGEKCVPIHGVRPATALAIGSTFKLYVLDALAHEVAAGKRKWTDTLPVRDEWKSLPSGDMRNEPAGRAFTLQHWAQRMIAVSDNTAADHLLFSLGRDKVEAAAKRAGNERNVPFLSTREMFRFKLLTDAPKQQKYLDASRDKRRKILDKHEDMDLAYALTAAGSWTDPRAIDQVEWMATAEELCNEALVLRSYGEQSPVHDILSMNPGVPDDGKTWTYVGYKGGSEPGVLNLTWVLQRTDGRSFFLTTTLNNPEKPLDEAAGIATAAAARKLLAATP